LRITIAIIGRDRQSPMRALFDDYAGRVPWEITLKEIDSKGRDRAAALSDAVPQGAKVVALDSRGKELSSEQWARQIGAWQDGGVRDLGFVIGGSDGLDRALIAHADLVLSLGAMTWPHLLVKALLAEQLYRAFTILSGHPYHRKSAIL
jgi:23S rRNA (pseudouridine1915-N3)-methyltransferase